MLVMLVPSIGPVGYLVSGSTRSVQLQIYGHHDKIMVRVPQVKVEL